MIFSSFVDFFLIVLPYITVLLLLYDWIGSVPELIVKDFSLRIILNVKLILKAATAVGTLVLSYLCVVLFIK